jgi:aminoglycoside phosphotransferase (APT) family kinase protein
MSADADARLDIQIPTKPQMRDLESVRPALQAWLRARVAGGGALEVVEVRLPTGAGVANETLLVTATLGGAEQGYVVRVGTTYHLFLGMDVATHYKLYKVLEGEPHIPSPPLVGFEPDPGLFGEPFFVMRRVEGRVPADNPHYYKAGWVLELTPDERARLWRNTVELMSKVHKLDLAKVSFLERPRLGRNGLEQEMNHWIEYARWCGGDSRPIVRKACQWLVDNMPKDPPAGFSWGDSRPPNVIYQGAEPAALLDWDMVSLCGPECDLAWWTVMDQATGSRHGTSRPSGLGTPRQTVALWEEFMGRKAQNLDWHLVLNALRSRLVMVRLPTMLLKQGLITADQAAQLDSGEMEWLDGLLDRPLADPFVSTWSGWDK